ncbi:MAG: SIS domain-containing protein, partial [Anaerolineae bacterium]|nr:SIS domain-containing protein [Anaerolineae bacterium]
MPGPYHMIGYIHENPDALRRTLNDNEARIEEIAERVMKGRIQRVIVFAQGSSYSAAVMAAPVFRYHCALPVHVLSASDLMYYAPRLVDRHTLAVGVSRSGERGQVIDIMKDCVERGAFCVAMTGVSDSLLAQNGDLTLLTSEGPEITFPKTKSVTVCAGLLMRLALALGTQDDESAARLRALWEMPEVLQRTLGTVEEQLAGLMPSITLHKMVVIAGTGTNYGVALEGAIKIP